MEGFQVFLSDQESANAYFRDKFKVEGVELESDNNALGYIVYKLKIYKDIFLENNKKFSCKNYWYTGDYNRVIVIILTIMHYNIIPMVFLPTLIFRFFFFSVSKIELLRANSINC